ncbi:MAG: pantetheine-phosphate adenylyltransferase [Candidatus Hydrothermales bacterium]
MVKAKSSSLAIYPGSFDPLTFGHVDLVKRALYIFDKVIIAVGTPTYKKQLLTVEERIELIKKVFQKEKRVCVEKLEGLLVNFAKMKKAKVIIRGLRAVSDFEYEFQMAWMNRKLNPDIEVIFMMPSEKYAYLSSTMVREIALLKGDLKGLVPPVVEEFIKKKLYK